MSSLVKGLAVGAAKSAASSAADVAKNKVQNVAVGAAKSAASSVAEGAKDKAQNLAITTALKQAPGGGVLAQIYTTFKDTGRKIKEFYQKMPPQYKIFLILAIIVVLGLIGYGIYYSTKPKTPDEIISQVKTQVDTNAATLGQLKTGLNAVGLTEGFQDCPVQEAAAKEEIKLLNLQPFTIKHAGFYGTSTADAPITSGAFDDRKAIEAALISGIRTFVLQIDYLATKPGDTWPEINTPVLLYKSTNNPETGTLQSTNAGSIRRVAQALADFSFNPTLPQKDDPVIIILHVQRTPYSDVEDPTRYLQFLGQIAAELEPLAPKHLRITSQGDFTRQSLEQDILTLPFKNFSKQFIIGTNIDTTLFRKQDALKVSILSAQNLDLWSNFRIYKIEESGNLGATRVAPEGTTPRFIMISKDKLDKETENTDKIKKFSDSIKGKFTIFLPQPDRNPDTTVVDKALDQVGINVIPLDIFSFTTPTVLTAQRPWKTTSWKLKPALLR